MTGRLEDDPASFLWGKLGQKVQGANVKLPNLHKVNLWEGVDKTQMSFHPKKKDWGPKLSTWTSTQNREVRCFLRHRDGPFLVFWWGCNQDAEKAEVGR